MVAIALGTAQAKTLSERINKSNQQGQGQGAGSNAGQIKGSIDDFTLENIQR